MPFCGNQGIRRAWALQVRHTFFPSWVLIHQGLGGWWESGPGVLWEPRLLEVGERGGCGFLSGIPCFCLLLCAFSVQFLGHAISQCFSRLVESPNLWDFIYSPFRPWPAIPAIFFFFSLFIVATVDRQ